MTVFLSLDAAEPFPSSPAFLVPSPDSVDHVKQVVKAVVKARRIVVVCGAGISVQAGIPDFRSSEGLFQSLKKKNPTIASGKDLFDASVFNSEDTISLFCKMIARLWQLSDVAEPTTFHQFLRVLDDRRCLFRVYTQNIDALEEKSGLTFGVPKSDVKWRKALSRKEKTPSDAPPVDTPSVDGIQPSAPPSYPLRDYIDTLASGTRPLCPQCTALEQTRQLVGKRSHGVGKLRPSVVLYNEDHKDGEEVGDVVSKDLKGSSKGKGRAGADLLLVVGTSLRVPGTKLIVREFSKAVRSQHPAMDGPSDRPADKPVTSVHNFKTPTPLLRLSPEKDGELPIQTILLNLDFPAPTKEWEGIFDVWVRGDVQTFARMAHEELEKQGRIKEAPKERKRKREVGEGAEDALPVQWTGSSPMSWGEA